MVLKYQYLPDGSDRITYISKRVKEYWGVEAEEVIEDINVGWARVVPEDIEPIRESIYESVQDLSVWNNLMRFISKTGEIKYLQGVGTPKKLENGIVEFDVVFIDITDEYLARKDLETKQHQLEVIGEQLPALYLPTSENLMEQMVSQTLVMDLKRCMGSIKTKRYQIRSIFGIASTQKIYQN